MPPPAGRAAAAGWTPCCCALPAWSTASPGSPSPMSTASMPTKPCKSAPATTSTANIHTLPPADRAAWDRAVPVYETLARLAMRHHRLHQLRATPGRRPRPISPASAELCGAPIAFVGVGPDRKQTLVVLSAASSQIQRPDQTHNRTSSPRCRSRLSDQAARNPIDQTHAGVP